MATTTDFYLLYTLALPVGSTEVKLYGGMEVAQGEFRFTLSKNLPYGARYIVAGDAVTTIDQPLGLKGVVLDDLDLSGRIYTLNGQRQIDLALSAAARFPGISGFPSLVGAMVIADSSPRLAMVALTSNPPLTLTQFLISVFGGYAAWASTVTDQFAFVRGSLYFLKAPDGSDTTYTFVYNQVTYYPGYHLDSKFLIFGNYEFDVRLSVNGDEFDLVTATPTTINVFDFVMLKDSSVEISSRRNDTHIKVASTVRFFNSVPDLGLTATYDTGQGRFTGTVDAHLPGLNIPGDGGSSTQDVTLTVVFQWTRDSAQGRGFTIVSISGLPTGAFNLVEKYTDVLNGLRGGGCQQIVSGWLNGMSTTTLKPVTMALRRSTATGR